MLREDHAGLNVAYFAFDQFMPSNHAGFVHTYSIVKAIKNIGNYVEIYGIPNGEDLFNIFRWRGRCDRIPLNYVRFTVSFKLKYKLLYPLNIISYYKTLESLNKQNPDIIHERFHVPNPYSIKICEALKIPKVLEVNSLYVEEGIYKGNKRTIALKQRKWHFDQCKAIITQTETLKEIIETLTDKPVFVVSNGVDTEIFNPDAPYYGLRDKLNLKNEHIVTFVGSFRKWHGVDQILEMARKLRTCNIKFLLIGSGELFEDIKNNKEGNMILVGAKKHAEIPQYLALSDILIAPFDERYFEGSNFWWNPVKLFEYMASGKPVISYNYSEVRNIVRDGGLLAEIGDLDDLIEKLEYLIENESLRKRLGDNGRKIAQKEYTWTKKAEETAKVYEWVI